jgi:hypothetical protein
MNQPTTNDIATKQNTDGQILRLAAMSRIYSRAKFVLGTQFILTVPAGLATAIIASQVPSLKHWTVTYSFAVALLDALFLEKYQNSLKKQGAKIQEAFDCDVLGLEWRKPKAGDPVDTETVREEGTAFLTKHPDAAGIRDWYPPVVSQIPLPLARLICQRANCWWDAKLRRRYSLALKVILWALTALVIMFGLQANQTLGQLALAFVAPLSPALLWGIREIRKQNEAAEALDKLRGQIEQVWEQALDGGLTTGALLHASTDFQNEIFERRSRHPLIFNWVNSWVRDKQELSMNDKAKELVAQANTHTAPRISGVHDGKVE